MDHKHVLIRTTHTYGGGDECPRKLESRCSHHDVVFWIRSSNVVVTVVTDRGVDVI